MRALLILALFLPFGARAAEGPQTCAADAAVLCPKAPSGPERLRCLHGHEARLSPACREHLASMHAEGQEFREACKADIGESCLNLERHALMECLEAKGDKLSKPCAERIAAIHEKHKSQHELIAAACRDDAQRLCKGTISGEGRIGTCLRAHEIQLSKDCAAALK